MFVLLVLSFLTCRDPKVHAPVELDAKTWWNAPAIRVPDNRTYLVVFFTSRVEDKVAAHIKTLERLNGRADLVVVALSPEAEEKVRAFVEKYKPHFAVGAGTSAFRRLNIRRWPQLVLLRPTAARDGDLKQEEVELGDQGLQQIEAGLGPREDEITVEPGAMDESTPRELLLRYVLHGPNIGVRLCALPLLREKMPPAEFLPLCDQLLAEGGPTGLTVPWRAGWLQALAYQRHLADPGVTTKVPDLTDGHAFRDLLQAGVDAQLLQDMYQLQLRSKPLAGVREDYLAHRTADPKDVLLRERVAGRLQECAEDNKAGVRALAMELLPLESEFSVRAMLLYSLYQTCSPGDEEAIGFLERQLETEREAYGARPFMQCLLDYLRTGVE